MAPFEQFSRRIIPTRHFDILSEFSPEPGSTYICGNGSENRVSTLATHMAGVGIATAFLSDFTSNNFALSFGGDEYTIGLTHGRNQDAIWTLLSSRIIYLDITSLPHQIWAILLKSAQRTGQSIQVLYIEPADYSRSRDVENFYEYDLSDAYSDFRGLPGFAMLAATGDDVSYIPILGFEGVRFKLATTEVDPPFNKTFPVIGLPGFRPEYPFEAYIANRASLDVEGELTLHNVHFVDASCPFCLYYTLEDIASSYQNDILKIALLGTKPHALGAVLYAMRKDTNKVQLLYDYPKVRTGRTSGIGRIHLYYVSLFLSTLATPAAE